MMQDLMKFMAQCLFYFLLAYALISLFLAVGCRVEAQEAILPALQSNAETYAAPPTAPAALKQWHRWQWEAIFWKDVKAMCFYDCNWELYSRPIPTRIWVREPK